MTTDDQTWQARAAAARKARLAPWRDCFFAGAIVGVAVSLAALSAQPGIRIPLIVLAVAAGVFGLVRGTLVYMRRIDEQERDANLWGCYAGMSAYLALYVLARAAAQFGIVVPFADDAIFLIVMAVTLAVFGWKRFR